MRVDLEKIRIICGGKPAQIGVEETQYLWHNYLAGMERNIVLEIGVNTGGSAKVWELMNFRTMIGIDKEWSYYLDLVNEDKILYYRLKGDSRSDEVKNEVHGILDGSKKVDLLYIDGGHDYDNCKLDYLNYARYVRSGGIILFHDTADIKSEVRKVYNECVVKHDRNEIIDIDHRGFGVFVV